MLLTIHDANLKKVAFIDNEKQSTLNYFDDIWTRHLETGSSTFEFTVFKKATDKTYNYLNEKAFVSFEYHGKSYVFNVMTVEENEQTITCYCENLNLELINEYTNSYKATKAMSFVEYCNAMDLLNYTYLSVGINEISDLKRTLEWDGQDTKLARLLSLAKKFDAEIEFDTRLNADSTIKSFKVNVYHKNDGTHQGVGRIRNDIQLTYGKNLKSITRKIDKTNVVNAIRPTGTKDGNTVTISGLSAWGEKNADGVVEFYQKGEMLYAPISMQLYPSAFINGTTNDQWTRKDITVDSDNPTVIRSAGIRELKKNAYPAITYDVDGFVDLDIGDTVKIHDDGFNPILLIEARVADQKISFTNPDNNKTTFANFTALENRLSDGIQERLNELIEQAKPYTIKLATDNGVIFKNQIGQSTITPSLYKGGKPVVSDVTWRWSLDGTVTTGMTYTVHGADVTDTATLTVSAYIGNNEVAVDEISFVNVLDGTMGTPGPPGADGQTPYVHWAYSDNADGTGLTTADNGQRYMGHYSDYTQADSTDKTKYKWADRWANIDSKADQAELEKVVYKTDISVTDEGIVHSATKTVNGQTIASMIAQRAEWVEIIANLLKVKGNMIVDGTISANKLSVSTLSALTADLGEISGGSLELLESVAQGTSVDAWGSFTIPAHKWGLYIDNIGAISSGTPVRKSSSESVASDMPVAVLTSGQLRFARVNQNNDLGSVLHYGLSDPDNATISFAVASDGTKQLLIQANGQIVNQGTNYTGWISTGIAGVYYKRQGDVVALKMQVTTTANQTYGLGNIPASLVPIPNDFTMMRVTAWATDQGIGRNLQINSDGSMFLLKYPRGDTFNTQVTWII